MPRKLPFALILIITFFMMSGIIHNKNIYNNIMLAKLVYKASNGDIVSQRNYGIYLLDSNKNKGEKWLLKAVGNSDNKAGQYLANWYGERNKLDKKLDILHMFEAKDRAWAHIELSDYYYSIGDEDRWFQYQLSAAELGHTNTNIFLGDLFFYGYMDEKYYIPADINLAFKYYNTVKHDGRALERLGDMYALGIVDTKQDFHKAVEMYQGAYSFNQSITAQRKLGNIKKYGLVSEFKKPEVIQTVLLLDSLDNTMENAKGGLLWLDSYIDNYYAEGNVDEGANEMDTRLREQAVALLAYECQNRKLSECALEYGDKLFKDRQYKEAIEYYYKALLATDDEYIPAISTFNNYLAGVYKTDRYTEQWYVDRKNHLMMQRYIYRQISKIWRYLGNSELSVVYYTEAVYLGDRYSQNLLGGMHIRHKLLDSDIIVGCSWVYISEYSAHNIQYCNDNLNDEDFEAVSKLIIYHFNDPVLVDSVIILRN